LIGAHDFQILERAISSGSTVKPIGPEALKLLQRADKLLKEQILLEKALRYGRIGTAAVTFIAGLLYSPDLGPAKAYKIHLDYSEALKEWHKSLGIFDSSPRLLSCGYDNVDYQKLLIYDYLEIYHDYALIPTMGLEELEVIPTSQLNHPVIKKAQQAGDLLGGYGNRMVVKRNFAAKAGTDLTIYSAYDYLIRKQLDKAQAENPALTNRDALEAVKDIICQVQKAMHGIRTWQTPAEQNYFQQKKLGDDLLIDPSWMEEYFIDPNEVELGNYERRLKNGDELSEIEWNHYLNLLCAVRNDCRYGDKKFEDHHLIPREMEDHPLVVAARKCTDKFYFNGKDNLLALEKYVVQTGQGRHGNHPKYNDWVRELLNKELQDYLVDHNDVPPNSCTAKEILLKVINRVLGIINGSKKTINEIGEEQLNLMGK
jgi:A nuclease family of the HNH/ENDO VII superfamily with conserved AHH